MKKLVKILVLMLLTNTSVAQFNANKTKLFVPKIVFKDGTVLNNMWIRFLHDDSPSHKGIILHSADGRVYFHHYPYRPPTPIFKNFVPDDGTYRTNKVVAGYKPIEHYKPPIKMSDFNPVHIPQCVPSRIPFIHFNKPTLQELHKRLTPYKKGVGSWPNEEVWATAPALEAIKTSFYHKPKWFEMNTPKNSKEWQNQVETEMRLSWPKLLYGKWLERK